MSCPAWEKCDQFKCKDEQVCLNVDFWARYWGSKERAKVMAAIPKPSKILRQLGQIYGPPDKCFYCERKWNGRSIFLTRDHIIPVSKGGNDDKRNLIQCCNRCNSLKDNRTPDQFAIFLGYAIDEGHKKASKDALITILYNTRNLILKIAPYREELYKFKTDISEPVKVEEPVVIPKEPKAIDWWKDVYLANCVPDPTIFHENKFTENFAI